MTADEYAALALTYLKVAGTFPSGSHGRAANWAEAAKYLNFAVQIQLTGEVHSIKSAPQYTKQS